MKAISIRQPWAWLIVNGYKDIENRSWRTKLRGTVLIHAGQKMLLTDYYKAKEIADSLGIRFPSVNTLMRDFSGGIVGFATITDCVEESTSPWFFGPKGYVLADAHPLPLSPLKGRLSFFETGMMPIGKYAEGTYAVSDLVQYRAPRMEYDHLLVREPEGGDE